MPRRVPQLRDSIAIELVLPPSTEEWADELLESCDGTEVERTPDALIARYEVAGNCDGISNLRSWLGEVEDALQEGDIDAMEFEVKVTALPPFPTTEEAAKAASEKGIAEAEKKLRIEEEELRSSVEDELRQTERERDQAAQQERKRLEALGEEFDAQATAIEEEEPEAPERAIGRVIAYRAAANRLRKAAAKHAWETNNNGEWVCRHCRRMLPVHGEVPPPEDGCGSALAALSTSQPEEGERCPTCGSDDPRFVDALNRKGKPRRFIWFDASILSDERRAHWHCPDPFHLTDPDCSTSRVGEGQKLAARIKAELHSDEDGTTSLAGTLGEAIADASGSYSLEFTTPEQVAEGFCNWLSSVGGQVGEVRTVVAQIERYICEMKDHAKANQHGSAYNTGRADGARFALNLLGGEGCTTEDCIGEPVASVRIPSQGGPWIRYCKDCARNLEAAGHPTRWDSTPEPQVGGGLIGARI